jgi:peptidoglycan/LPS O-acetylase OafA/YrhL
MSRETSLYLDIVRFAMAMIVLIGHLASRRLSGGFLWQLAPLMGNAVTIFFVLSGFVIAFATDTRERSPTAYVAARAGRLYSVVLPALLLTFALDAIGRAIRPDLYSPVWGYQSGGEIWHFICGLLFVNEIWFAGISEGSAVSYWSLSYEAWYYVIFGIAVFSSGRLRVLGLIAVLVFVGPNIVIELPLWLLGVWTYRYGVRSAIGPRAGAALFAGSLVMWIAYEISALRYGRLFIAWTTLPGWGLVPQYLMVGALFAANIIGFQAISPVFKSVLNLFARPIRWAAGATFSIYLLHVPVAQFLSTVVPWPPPAWQTRIVIYGGTLLAILVFAEITERRKEPWRRAFASALAYIPSPVR